MSRRFVSALWLVSAVFMAAGPIFGGGIAPQNQSTDANSNVVLRFDVNLVQMDVVVTASKGRRVMDLGPEDFQVFQDG